MLNYTKPLLNWYTQNYRKLPWRETTDPYKIWISEIMLQQTRVAAVLPLYKNFLKHFPNIKKLAAAKQEEVLEQWAGLGYYSRARNIHKAGQILIQQGFPKSYDEILKLPGFGPYTSRAVSSFAFQEKVGVLDGNVIRLLSRIFNKKAKWWTTKGRQDLQEISDQMAQHDRPDLVNQALIELGATICLPKNPSCMVCPWKKQCLAFKNRNTQDFPLKKAKKATEYWQWNIYQIERSKELALISNTYAPFLKGHLIHPGNAKQLSDRPKNFHFKHSVTHHEIYITIKHLSYNELKKSTRSWSRLYGFKNLTDIEWVIAENLKAKAQSSYIQKVLQHE